MPDYEAPIELAPCRTCGHKAKLHRTRNGRWYVACDKKNCKNRTEDVISKRTVCQVWNVRQEKHD